MPSEVKILADSINPVGIRLTTFELSVHLFIWAEFLTHRVMSRNAQSNRAIPTQKIIESVSADIAYPFHWGKNKAGMQADGELPADVIGRAKAKWTEMALRACEDAKYLAELGLAKQVVNRALAPYMYIKVILSATTWKNFFDLRIDEAAQPEIAIPAARMRDELEKSRPVELGWGEWHMPLVWAEEWDIHPEEHLIKISAARAARVSYLTHLGTRDLNKDVELHDKLLKDVHMSPFEHVAIADEQQRTLSNYHPSWMQYRKVIESHNPYILMGVG